jgi:hypothetical protein
MVLGLQKVGLYAATGVLVFDLVVIAAPILVGWMGSKFLGPLAAKVPGAATV